MELSNGLIDRGRKKERKHARVMSACIVRYYYNIK